MSSPSEIHIQMTPEEKGQTLLNAYAQYRSGEIDLQELRKVTHACLPDYGAAIRKIVKKGLPSRRHL